MKNLTRLLCFLILTFSCNPKQESGPVATMYYGGDIITMEGDEPIYAEALVEKEGEILFIGAMNEAMEIAGKKHQMKNLDGKTLVPGFIDGHAHFGGFGAQAVAANLLASPDGEVNSIPELLAELKSWYASNGIDKTQGWIVGLGFDDAVLAENRFPTKEDLDQVSTEVPICIIHISGHFAVMNSKGLEMSNVTAESKDPAGGVIRRMPGSQEPNGGFGRIGSNSLIFSNNRAFGPKTCLLLPRQVPRDGCKIRLYYCSRGASHGQSRIDGKLCRAR